MRIKPIRVVTHREDMLPAPPAPPPEPLKIPEETFGLGDAVALLAQPIARAVDKLTGSKLATCTPCSRRHSRLNRFVPDVRKPFKNLRLRK